jgi:peptidyl-prolyl cis-trans isomerase B (cyclophilin B)
MIILTTNKGTISLALDYDNAPITAKNFESLVREGYYDNTIFHRVIKGFMIQGGGFGSGMDARANKDSIDNEADNGLQNVKGSIAMARTADPHSASTQFFINTVNNDFLNFSAKNAQGWGYCVFGKVVEGMDIVEQIQQASTSSQAGHQDVPVDDIVIEKATVEVEVKE